MDRQKMMRILNNCLVLISRLTVTGAQQAALVVNLHNSISALINELNQPEQKTAKETGKAKEQSDDSAQHEISQP